jgi:hypothetical protein
MQILGKLVFFEKLKIKKNQNSPFSPLPRHFDSLAKGGELCNRNSWQQRGVFMTVATTLQWAANFHAAIFKQINQVTHQSSFQEKKLRKDFDGCVEILHEEFVFFLQIDVYLPGSSVVLAVGSDLFVSC